MEQPWTPKSTTKTYKQWQGAYALACLTHWGRLLPKSSHLLLWRGRIRVPQSALQREERFIHGLVQWAADRLGQAECPLLVQPMVDSFASASSTEASFYLSGVNAMGIGAVFVALPCILLPFFALSGAAEKIGKEGQIILLFTGWSVWKVVFSNTAAGLSVFMLTIATYISALLVESLCEIGKKLLADGESVILLCQDSRC